jgi:hypothetical protein
VFHPQSNGMVERAHRQLKNALRARTAGHDWPSHLPWVLLGLRTAPKEDSNLSSAELCLGAPLILPGEFMAGPEPPPQEFVDSLQAAPPPPSTRPRSYAQVAAAPPASLLKAEFVSPRRHGAVPPAQRCRRPGAARPSRPLVLLQCRPEDATEGGNVASVKSGSRI